MPDALPRIGSALLVRDEADRILLGKRNKDPQRGSWVIPGGRIEAFETIANAAAREIQEETGLVVEVQHQFGVYEIVNPPDEHRIIIYSWGKLVAGTPKASTDLSELRFFSLNELGSVPTTPLVRRVLADAGLIPGAARTLQPKPEQPRLCFVPILIAGASEQRGAMMRKRRPSNASKQRAPKIDNSPLLFDNSLSS
jgi:8-oxo-dGTP diphosphatase